MVNFEQLNQQTKLYNSTIHYNSATFKYGTKEYWQNYYNNSTYKENNGIYSKHYI